MSKYQAYWERFWSRVQKTDGCWIWTGAKSTGGYGQLRSGTGIPYKTVCEYAHRISYEHHIGPIPAGLVIDHLCRNRACINPLHLEAVTQRLNNLRGESLFAVNALKTHCKRGHPLDESNTGTYHWKGHRAPQRYCKICRRTQQRTSKAAKALRLVADSSS